jgi:hypothetical protein
MPVIATGDKLNGRTEGTGWWWMGVVYGWYHVTISRSAHALLLLCLQIQIELNFPNVDVLVCEWLL